MENIKNTLLQWYFKNKRDLPWRNTNDPYKIWVSEVMLQQTQVENVKAYYHRFINRFPDISTLAESDENEVLNYWQGLGYYSRARNLHEAMKFVSSHLNGIIPHKYEDLLKLKGVGPYTAAAIGSICFNNPTPVIDGNVYRVISRLFGIETEINTANGIKEVEYALNSIFDRHNSGDFNQAIMEFGAIYCKPHSPYCSSCIFKYKCQALKIDKVEELPRKKSKRKPKDVYMYYLVKYFKQNGDLLIQLRKRSDKGIWKNMYDFPVLESPKSIDEAKLRNEHIFDNLEYSKLKKVGQIKHQLTHLTIFSTFFEYFSDAQENQKLDKDKIFVSVSDLDEYPLPRLIEKYFESSTFYIKNKDNH